MTVASLMSGSTEQLGHHLGRALENGATQDELKEVITHLAFLCRLAEGDVRHDRGQAGLRGPLRHVS